MTTDPAIREAEARGARREREAMRKKLRSTMATQRPCDNAWNRLDEVLTWLLTREARYKRAAGGLKGRGGR